MSAKEFATLFDKRYRSVVVVLMSVGFAAWAIVGAVNRFTTMVDERAQRVIETFAVKPLQEHKDFERRIAQNEKDISGLLESQKLMDRNLTRLMDLAVRRGDIPVQIASPGMRP